MRIAISQATYSCSRYWARAPEELDAGPRDKLLKLYNRPHAATYVFDSALETRSKSFASHTANININGDMAI